QHHGVHEVRKAAKKAVAFELRKVVKRGANTGTRAAKGEDAAELERQLEAVKNADHEQFADTALRTKVLKDKLLAQHADVAGAIAEKLAGVGTGAVAPQEPGSAAAKVHGRLLSSKTVAEAVRAVVDGLREAVDPSLGKGKSARGQGEEEGSGDSEDEDEDGDDELAVRPAKGKKPRLVEDEAHGGGSDSEEEAVDDAGWESGTVDGDEGGWESGSVDSGDNGIGIGVADSSDEEEEDEEDEDGESSEDEALKPKAKPAAKDTKGKAKAASTGGGSTFLPSLAVGFTRGDSDASDLSEDEATAADVPRKNRRGQRARRAIWEKKYGNNANHVKSNQQQQQQPPNRGRASHDPRQPQYNNNKYGGAGAYPQQRQGGQGPQRGGRDTYSSGGRGATGWSPGAARGGGTSTSMSMSRGGRPGAGAREETALHPSWEAKRRLKEKLNPGIVPSQGKKITF
ncbi:Bud-site selection protein, partial [Daedaleopsis nitida]